MIPSAITAREDDEEERMSGGMDRARERRREGRGLLGSREGDGDGLNV